MVGVPRSSGCERCRKRRVKCDEARPSCGNCLRYGALCPGYQRGLKFVTEKHHIRSRDGKTAGHRDGTTTGSGGSDSTRTPSSTSSGLTPPEHKMMNELVTAPAPNRDQFIGTILEQFHPTVASNELGGMFSWFDIRKVGQKAVLDGAMCSLSMHMFGKEVHDPHIVAKSRTLYGQCLGELQSALKHPTEWKAPETLCSAILLCMFELYAGTATSDTWLQHARGISVLMESRGPAAYEQGWDAAMLLSFRGILIMADMFFPRSDRCFLSRPEWRYVARDRGRGLAYPAWLNEEAVNMLDDYFKCLAEVPAVLSRGYGLRERRSHGIEPKPDELVTLGKMATETHEHFAGWHETSQTILIPPEEILSEDPEPLYASVLEYKSPWIGSLLMGYWASMLILQETLIQCQVGINFDAAQEEFVKNILRSLETVGQGIMGPYRVGYSVRIAYDFASAEAQGWIRNKLDSYKSIYAATDKETYPQPRIDNEGYG